MRLGFEDNHYNHDTAADAAKLSVDAAGADYVVSEHEFAARAAGV